MKTLAIVASIVALVAQAPVAQAQSGRSTMTIIDESEEMLEDRQPAPPAVTPSPVPRTTKPASRKTPAQKPFAAARPAPGKADAPKFIRASVRGSDLYRTVLSKGINEELKRLGCFRGGVKTLQGSALEVALQRYVKETGSYTHIAYPPSVVLAELIAQDAGLCLGQARPVGIISRDGQRRMSDDRASDDGRAPDITISRKTPRVRIYR